MFKAYNPDDIPDSMPFPELALIATAKGDEIAVPRLNEYQRSWILDVGIRGVDLPNLTRKETAALYDKVKTNAFDAKAFQHKSQPGDQDEEDSLPALVRAWKEKTEKKSKKTAQDDGGTSDDEEDEDGRAALLRGYTKAGWRLVCSIELSHLVTVSDNARQAIQKVMSNKRVAERLKRKTKIDDAGESSPEAPALAKLLGLTAYSGRHKFGEDRHDEIHDYSKTISGKMNTGGKFRKAEALLWAQEDQTSWEAAAKAEENVDWAE
jgi:hypothetical protein